MIFDTNVVIDLIDGVTAPKVLDRLVQLCAEHDVSINEIIYAEIAGRFGSSEQVDRMLELLGLRLTRLSTQDCYSAGVAFRAYRQNGGPRTTILPDFLIGAQAECRGWPVITRDRKGFATHFPKVELIDPYEEQP